MHERHADMTHPDALHGEWKCVAQDYPLIVTGIERPNRSEVQVLPDLDVGVTSGHGVQQLLGGAHSGDLGLARALLQSAQACWPQTMPLIAILHSCHTGVHLGRGR
jgi:hypothetical protein